MYFVRIALKKEFEEKARNIKIILPTLTFQDQIELDLGGVTCVLKHVGGDHAHDSVVIYVKEEKDIIFRRLYICRYLFFKVELYDEKNVCINR